MRVKLDPVIETAALSCNIGSLLFSRSIWFSILLLSVRVTQDEHINQQVTKIKVSKFLLTCGRKVKWVYERRLEAAGRGPSSRLAIDMGKFREYLLREKTKRTTIKLLNYAIKYQHVLQTGNASNIALLSTKKESCHVCTCKSVQISGMLQ